MKMRQLEYFLTIAEEGGFNRAAKRLHVAQPSLSVQIKTLEDEIGAELFERDKRHVFLTQAGKQFYQHASAILSLANTAKTEALCAGAGELGTLDLGYSASAMFSHGLAASIRRFRQQYPYVIFTLHDIPSREQLHRIMERTLDVGILRKPNIQVPDGIEIIEWHRTPLIVAIQSEHPLARRSSLSLSQLKDEPFVTYPREAGTGIYWQFNDLCANAGFRPRVAREVLESTAIVGLVAAGVGVAVVPAGIQCIQFEGVSYRNLTDSGAFSILYLARRTGDGNQHLATFCDMLSTAAGSRRLRKSPARLRR
ncbi:MAG TPA: LysR substrate-binding domain-containing protein [Steroidobacteraceae bacterium]|jgi:DNA-binding transcriptional LysR family regulator|nr:LysR substrate-binding domain-containing protein [Steroidobacteraceae bacterium]